MRASSSCRTRLGAMVVVAGGLLAMWGLATPGAFAARADAPGATPPATRPAAHAVADMDAARIANQIYKGVIG